MSRTLIAILALFTLQVQSQINCNLFKWKNDTVCYKACNMADTASEMEQGSAGSQKLSYVRPTLSRILRNPFLISNVVNL